MDTTLVVVVVLVALVCLAGIRALSAGAARRGRDAAGRIDLSPRPGFGAPGDLPPGVWEALQQGRKIEAIRLYRLATGVGLKEAKDRVEAAERGTAPIDLSPRLGVGTPGELP
ncbi:MAG TPA: hypothetical protein VKS60_24685, partial [Stellaceae bacterium]|nr:hypothetical protein [Stellaceae bacterium]